MRLTRLQEGRVYVNPDSDIPCNAGAFVNNPVAVPEHGEQKRNEKYYNKNSYYSQQKFCFFFKFAHEQLSH
jgi:hypothetical protein